MDALDTAGFAFPDSEASSNAFGALSDLDIPTIGAWNAQVDGVPTIVVVSEDAAQLAVAGATLAEQPGAQPVAVHEHLFRQVARRRFALMAEAAEQGGPLNQQAYYGETGGPIGRKEDA